MLRSVDRWGASRPGADSTTIVSTETREAEPPRPLARLVQFARPHIVRIGAALLLLLVASGIGLVIPYVFGQLVESTFVSADTAVLNRHALALFVLLCLRAAIGFAHQYLTALVGERVVADLRVTIYGHLLRLPPSFFETRATGELLSRLGGDVQRLRTTVASDAGSGLRSVVLFFGAGSMLVWGSPRLTVLVLACVPVLIGLGALSGRVLKRRARRATDAQAAASTALHEGVSGMETVQAFGRESHELVRYRTGVDDAFDANLRWILARGALTSATTFAAFSAAGVVLWLGAHRVVEGTLGAGDLTSFLIYGLVLADAMVGLVVFWSSVQSCLGAVGRVFEILDRRSDISSPADPTPISWGGANVVFSKVSFAYHQDGPVVLHDIDLTIAHGEIIAIVGPSGSGKTTLTRLLQRFYDPRSGRVTVGEVDMRSACLDDLRGGIAIVSQEPMLFSDSIAENIRYGRPGATDAEVAAAASQANVDEFAEALPEGYRTQIGERGRALSGGQRQRISIARALLRNPHLLILDEATSALDTSCERLVVEALDRVQAGRTTLVISHRLATVRRADRIVVLTDGRVVEQGSHPQLMEKRGVYAAMVAA